jgi:hypothetical protein
VKNPDEGFHRLLQRKRLIVVRPSFAGDTHSGYVRSKNHATFRTEVVLA